MVPEDYFSDQKRVTIGVPSGRCRGPLLFVVYINDLDEKVVGMVNKVADDIKIGGIVDNEETFPKISTGFRSTG